MQQVDRARGGAPIGGAHILARVAQDRIPVFEQRMALVAHIRRARAATRRRLGAAKKCAQTIDQTHVLRRLGKDELDLLARPIERLRATRDEVARVDGASGDRHDLALLLA